MTTIVKPDALRGFHKDTRAAIAFAVDNGWTAHRLGGGGIRLVPPDGVDERPHRIPLSTKPFAGLKRLRGAIMRHIDPGRRLMVGAIVESEDGSELNVDSFFDAFEPDEIPVVEQTVERLPYVVDIKPWMARKAPRKDGGLLYPSHAVLERTWSNGLVDYLCAHDGCDWCADNPQSVARHYGGTHSRGQGATPQAEPTSVDPTYTEPINHRGYTPTERMVGLVAEQVRIAIAAGMDSTQIAAALLTWLHERPDYEKTHRDLDLTPEAILDRIRVLVDRDPVARQLEDAQQQMRDALVELEEARHEITRLHEERQALKELLS